MKFLHGRPGEGSKLAHNVHGGMVIFVELFENRIRMKKYFLNIAMIVVTGLAMGSCSHEHDELAHEHDHDGHEQHDEHCHDGEEEHDGEKHEGAHHEGEIELSVESAKRFGVTVEELKFKPFSEVIRVSGQIVPAAGDQGVVSATASGIFTLNSGLTVGSRVSAGQTIGTISAKGLQGGDANQAARVELESARGEVARMKPLLEDGIVSQKEFNAAEARVRAAEAAYSGSSSGGAAVARVGGVITELTAHTGQFVNTGEPVAVISQNVRMTLRADVPEKYYAFLPKITSANFRPDYSSETIQLSSLGGQLVSPATASGAKGGYIPVYFSFDNRGGIAPGAFAEVYLIGANRGEVLTVPLSAIVEIQGNYYVYTQVHEDAYAKHLVSLGGNDGVSVEIVSGLTAGERVVTSGARVVQMAESSNVTPPGHSHNH